MDCRFCIQDPTHAETTYLYEAIIGAAVLVLPRLWPAVGSRAPDSSRGSEMKDRPRRVIGSRMTMAQLVAEISEKGSLSAVSADFQIDKSRIMDSLIKLADYLNEQDKEDVKD